MRIVVDLQAAQTGTAAEVSGIGFGRTALAALFVYSDVLIKYFPDRQAHN
jgi:hypothetical protein